MRAVPRARRLAIAVALGVAAALGWPGPAAAPASDATAPRGRPPVGEGQPGRLTLGGRWRFRLDDRNEGVRRGYMGGGSSRGWKAISLPYDWNAREVRTNRSSVGWYRRDFVMPRSARGTRWIVHFEGAGHFATVYLNGRLIARHGGDPVPFEADLRNLRRGVNRLVVRIDSRRARSDLTHWRPARFNGYGDGMWWNFGGIHREVSVRPVRGLDIVRSQAMPRMACPTCAATVQVRTLVRNLGTSARRTRVRLTVDGQTVSLPAQRIAPGRQREVTGELAIARPRLWGIRRGNLYRLDVAADDGGRARAAYRTWFGVRDVRKRADGQVMLNGSPLRLQGISAHEDSPAVGSAWRAPQRAELLRRVDDLGATVVRAHYPLHPALMEALDRRGVMVWEQAPVNQVQNDQMRRPSVRRNAIRANEEMVLRDRGHASVLAFSIANELPVPVSQGQIDFVRQAAARVRQLDPTRLVAIDRVARYGAPDDGHPVWGAVDAIGVNEYFGWYRGAFAPRPPATTTDLGSYLDTLHAKQPHAALFITEFGAEANRRGSPRRKGTYAFQARYVRDHLEIASRHPYLNGAIVWNLRDFRVYPGWSGGNPKPHPPYNTKGLIGIDGRPKPAYYEVRRLFRGPR